MRPTDIHRGFTLIELLITVAILAVLVGIAVPNLMDAHIRAKVSRCQADMRAVAQALETYAADQHNYPVASRSVYPLSARIRCLSTPVAYLTHIPRDPFPDGIINSRFPPNSVDTFDYWDVTSTGGRTDNTLFGRKWRLASAGPDLVQLWGAKDRYDPTNGTKTPGDIIRVQGGGDGVGFVKK